MSDAYFDQLASRLAQRNSPVGVSVMIISDDGVEERHYTPTGEPTDMPSADSVQVRFEFAEDLEQLVNGTIPFSGLIYAGRAEIDGTHEAVNATAPALALTDHDFVPFVTRAAILTDAQLQAMLDDEGIPSLQARFLAAVEYAYTLIDLVSHIGKFRTRWIVDGHPMDSVADDTGIHVQDADPTAEIGTTVTYQSLPWIRWLGTSCAPPADPAPDGELTFLDGLLSGQFAMEGNPTSLEAVGRLLPHSR